MPKFASKFLGVPEGEIYPIEYQPGDDCPSNLTDAARALGMLEPELEVNAGEQGDASNGAKDKARKS